MNLKLFSILLIYFFVQEAIKVTGFIKLQRKRESP